MTEGDPENSGGKLSPTRLPGLEIDISNLHPQVAKRFWPQFHSNMRDLIKENLGIESSSSAEEIVERALGIPVDGLKDYLIGTTPNLSHASWKRYALHMGYDDLPFIFLQISQRACVESAALHVEEEEERLGLNEELGLRAMRRLVADGKVYPRYKRERRGSSQDAVAEDLEDVVDAFTDPDFLKAFGKYVERAEYPEDFR